MRKHHTFKKALILTLSLFVVFGYQNCASSDDDTFSKLSKNSCEMDGINFKLSERAFTNECNECLCTDAGMMCTMEMCDTIPEEPVTSCKYNGVSQAVGDTFPSADGCNTCSCTEVGIMCTSRACELL